MEKKNWRLNVDYRVYLVTDRTLCLKRPLEEIVLAAVQGGATLVQLREKNATSREFLELACLLVRELHSRDIPLIINDRADIALASGAAGLHIGQNDLPARDARALLGTHAILGLSVETMEDVQRGNQEDVDYLAASPLFATPTKTDTAPAWGLEGLTAIRQQTSKPLVAIGGIHNNNAPQVIAAGADGLAIVSEICSAPDPAQAACNLREIWTAHSS